jgi:hypothetical protein
VLICASWCQLQRAPPITGLIMPESIQLSTVSRLAIVVAALDAGPQALNALSAALFFKHKGYKNEKEFRFLQVFRADETPPELMQRFRSYEVVKYREFDWRLTTSGALKQIIVGPAADRHKAKRFAEDCLAAFNCGKVPATHSDIPYRAV